MVLIPLIGEFSGTLGATWAKRLGPLKDFEATSIFKTLRHFET